MKSYRLKILTPEKSIYDSEVVSITVNAENGGMSVLADHAAMTAMLAEGPLIVRTSDQEIMEGVADRGVLWVADNEAAVMVHTFRWASEETPENTYVGDFDAEDSLF